MLFRSTPSATNQAGSLPLSRGTQIICALQNFQSIMVFTDTSLYTMQYLGPPYVWNAQLVGSNISIISPNAAIVANNTMFWMGNGKFYSFSGSVQTLRCDVKAYIFDNINLDQSDQIFAGTVERFNEVWWYYCSAGSTVIDKYVDRKSTRLNSSHIPLSRMPSSA